MRGVLEITDHLIHIVLQIGHLTCCLNGNFLTQVTVGHGRGHLGDGPYLCGKVGSELVHIVCQVLPSTTCARHLSLASKLTFHTHFAGNGGHLGRECVKRVDHGVDRISQLCDLALSLQFQLLRQVASCDRCHHFGDAPHLGGKVVAHGVHVVGQVLPSAGYAFHLGLASQFSL